MALKVAAEPPKQPSPPKGYSAYKAPTKFGELPNFTAELEKGWKHFSEQQEREALAKLKNLSIAPGTNKESPKGAEAEAKSPVSAKTDTPKPGHVRGGRHGYVSYPESEKLAKIFSDSKLGSPTGGRENQIPFVKPVPSGVVDLSNALKARN